MTKTKPKRTVEEYLALPYSRVLVPDAESGGFTATIQEFPGCVTEGDSVEEAYERLHATAEGWILAALEQGQEIPEPHVLNTYSGRLLVRFPKSLHRKAAQFAERDGVSLNQFVVAAVAETVGTMGGSSPTGADNRRDGGNPDCPDCCRALEERKDHVFGGWQCNHCRMYWTINLIGGRSFDFACATDEEKEDDPG